MQLTYGSVCSGIEAASVAWEPLGFRPEWFSEIEAFPSAVLAHHWPHVTNLGDMTKIAAAVRAGAVVPPDVIVGGTPCQAFSVAGARAGLSDPRGQLTISYVDLADAIDDTRTAAGKQPAIFLWENVPGVLSSKDNAFGAFLGLLAGEDCELQPPGGKWKNSGFVHGPKRTIAWRVLNAEHFGVAQRRRRVFVVSSARKDFDPKKVLFEREGVRRDTAPSRSPREIVAALTANGVGTCGADDNQGQAGHLVAAFGGGNCSGAIEVAACLTARGQRIDFEVETFLAQYSSTGQGFWSEGCGTLRAREQESHEHLAVMSVHGTQDPDTNLELAHTLGRNNGAENAVLTELSVRRLTPVECERLQGFPDNHTFIPTQKRKQITADEYAYVRHHFPEMTAEEAYKRAVDGPRYKAIGNSMAVPCMAWIGRRIIQQLEGAM